MEYVIHLIRYDLECHIEELSVIDKEISIAKKTKHKDNLEFFTKEKEKLDSNIKQLKNALKILTY